VSDFRIVITNQVANAAATTSLNLQGIVQSMTDQGMTKSQVRSALMRDLTVGGPIFSGFQSNVRNITKNGVEWASNDVQKNVYNEAGIREFQWQTASDGKECSDCAERDQERGDMEYWETVGVPKSGFSVCTSNCRCILVPLGEASERIRRTKPEKPFQPITQTRAKNVATQSIAKAQTLEPKLTRLLTKMAESTGGVMMGLEHRFKTLESLTGKIKRQSKERKWTAKDTIEHNLKDTIRYAMTFEPVKYTQGVTQTIKALERQGWKFEKIKNTWANIDYHGIGAVGIKNGQRFELQFHTKQGWKVKDEISEGLYKKIGAFPKNLTGPQRLAKRRLEQQLREAWAPVELPPGVLKIGKLDKPDPRILQTTQTVDAFGNELIATSHFSKVGREALEGLSGEIRKVDISDLSPNDLALFRKDLEGKIVSETSKYISFIKPKMAGEQDLVDSYIANRAKELKFDKKPVVLSNKDFDNYVKRNNSDVMYRGINGAKASQYIDDFQNGDYFAGTGIHGNGTYVATDFLLKRTKGPGTSYVYKKLDVQDISGLRMASEFAKGGTPGRVMKMTLRPDARVIHAQDLAELIIDIRKELDKNIANAIATNNIPARNYYIRYKAIFDDHGRAAMELGYDAYQATHQNIIVIVNRGAVVMTKETLAP